MPDPNENDQYESGLFDEDVEPSDGPIDDSPYRPTRIVSGGQTGVDRAGLDFAIESGIEHGGWCPKGRLAEDGSIPTRYQLTEHTSRKYPPRTAQNVIDSDATLILHERVLKGGTLLTREVCKRYRRPYFVVRIDTDELDEAKRWLKRVRPKTLNIAGSRSQSAPGIYDRALAVLRELLRE
ncbi:putative molybdenum carrier [Rubripirellula tenax]|uniref:Putative molybdenum carrier n=1 Tax=Rubripirellula tenax TaxID=2528015 RepID=A0A5C6FJE6_9BACT|nr:putative molybdenum carrier protein [Rubripirellula tenax]TWU60713.1 putative molybdenum carrier [Rubripirellula tenax]